MVAATITKVVRISGIIITKLVSLMVMIIVMVLLIRILMLLMLMVKMMECIDIIVVHVYRLLFVLFVRSLIQVKISIRILEFMCFCFFLCFVRGSSF